MRGVMDAVSDPAVRQVVVMSAAQVGKTEVLLNVIGYHIDQDPAPMLIVQPTLSMAQAFSKDRLAPMVRDTGALKGKIKHPRARDSGNTTLHKVFPGGHVTIAGANSAAGLASRPVRIVLCDEVDRYPSSAGTEGDPVRLAEKRASTFWNSKIVTVSTPTVKNASRIEAEYLSSDQREYWVACAHCSEPQVMRWASVQWQSDQPETAVYVCEHCGVAWSDADRLRAIKRGEWRAGAEFKGVAGFRLSGLSSPWLPITEAARDFLEAKKLPETLRVWVNTYLGETWEESGEGVDDIGVADRREDYEGCPDGVVLITAGVDVQDDRLEVEIVGWGRDEESWSVDYRTIYGDPASPGVWGDLDAYLNETWAHPRGIEMPVRAACVDSGGHHTQAVYTFCKSREGRRIFAIKGVGGEGRALLGRATVNNIGKVKLFPVGVDSAKELIYARLKIADPGPGYCHFPARYDDEYFRQLTAEKIVTRFAKGFRKREWKKTRPRNEALDCRVYALAAYALLNARINTIADRFARPREEQKTETPPPIQAQRRQPRRAQKSGFVNSWR
tara:strand:- start:642 stop:2315 length:1674 start_codon:yes stop_codon:yes gene_type:complete